MPDSKSVSGLKFVCCCNFLDDPNLLSTSKSYLDFGVSIKLIVPFLLISFKIIFASFLIVYSLLLETLNM